jgi:hypothetical protein
MKNSNSNNVTTLDINALTWFDKVNGNSYFSAQIVVDYGTPSEHTIKLPFQYGYGDQYRYEAINELVKLGYLTNGANWYDLKESGIICRFSKIDAKKAEVKQFAL